MPGVVLIVWITDICLLPYFLYSHEYRLTRNTVYCAILSDQIVVGCPLDVPISYYVYIIILFTVLSMLLTGVYDVVYDGSGLTLIYLVVKGPVL